MMNKITTHNIECLEDLQQQVVAVKHRIKQREQDFEERWQRLPTETIKATLGKVIPIFINNSIAGNTWNILQEIFKFFTKNNEKNNGWKQTLAGPAKQVGVMAVIKLLMGLVKK